MPPKGPRGEDRTAEVLRTTEERLRLVLAGANLGTWDWNVVTGDVSFDERWAGMLGYALEEIKGHLSAWERLVHPDDMPGVMEALDAHLQGTTDSYASEHRMRHKSGQWVWVLDTGRVIERDARGRPLRACGIHLDVSARKQAEKALRESEQRMRSIVETVPGWVLTVDRGGTITFINRVVPGSTIEEVVGTDVYQHMPTSNHPAFKKALEEVFTRGEVVELETAITPTGSEVVMWNLNRIGPVLEGDEIVGATIASTDITDRKRHEDERMVFERQAHAKKLESLGVLAGGVAHDFNNLLMVILGNADLALDALSPMSPARGRLEQIEKASRRAARLAGQMLAYSGKGSFVVAPIDAGELVKEMAHLLEASIPKAAKLEFDLAPNLPSFDGDVTQIRQVVMNLITNAGEAFGNEGGVITLSTGAMECDRDYLETANLATQAGLAEPLPEGVYTYFEVDDTGCGMDAETIQKIFDPFFTTKFTGRGLGLSAALGIVRGHKGVLGIQSEVGKGSTFKILFPSNDPAADGFAARSKDEAEGQDWRGSGTILLADDEETVRAVGKQMLERLGFSVLTAPEGREALKVFREHADEIVCVLLDLTMPHMDGEEAFLEMRRLRPGAAVILCSGYDEQDATRRFAGKGLAGFLQKPFDLAALREKLVALSAAGGGEGSHAPSSQA
jgi:PAS domain S-box-containing protein